LNNVGLQLQSHKIQTRANSQEANSGALFLFKLLHGGERFFSFSAKSSSHYVGFAVQWHPEVQSFYIDAALSVLASKNCHLLLFRNLLSNYITMIFGLINL